MYKDLVLQVLEDRKEDLHKLSRFIWERPELAYQETQAHDYLTEFLEREGFRVTRNYILPTAFKAEYSRAEDDGPSVAICSEYDALPDIGHGCGHNLISEAAVAAGLAVVKVMKECPDVHGKVVIIGTPAEESGAGKKALLDGNAFTGVDAAIIAHPTAGNVCNGKSNARITVNVTFRGRAVHAAGDPWNGSNALDAAVAAYVNISMLRQQMKPAWRVHGIFVKGGSVPNIIPDDTQLQFMLRAPTKEELDILHGKVQQCFQSAATATGCTASIESFDRYLNLIPNDPLAGAYYGHGESLGVKFDAHFTQHLSSSASTDFGNVSHCMPAIHPMFDIGGTASNHTADFTAEAGADEAQGHTLKAAAAVALTVLDVLTQPNLLRQAWEFFREAL